MADNVEITAGAGTTVHADEYTHGTLGSGKSQLVKLVDGTLNSDTAVGVPDVGAKANALRVCPANDITDGTYIADIKFGEAEPNSAAILADTTAILADTAAMDTNIATMVADTTSIDGKITACNTGAVVLSSGTVTTVSTVTNLSQLGGTAISMNEGTVDAGTQRVSLATDDDGVAHLATIAGAISGTEAQVDLVSTNRANAVEAVTDWTAVAQNTVVESGTIDCSGHDATSLNIQAFLDSTTAHTGTKFQIQVSYNTSGDEDWSDYREFVALIGTANSEAITNDPLTAASTTITMADTGGNYETPPMGRWLAIEDGTLANSELVLNTGYTADTSITILDGTTNEHAQTTPMYDIAMSKTIILDSTVNRARVVVNNTYDVDGSTLNYKVRATKLTR